MMAFLEEVEKLTGLSTSVLSDGYRIINFSGKAVYIEGIKNILSFDAQQTTFKLKKGVVKVAGDGLVIKELLPNTALVTGSILAVEVG